MKVKTKLNKQVGKTNKDKEVRHRFSKKDFVGMLSDADKYPLSMRIAAELFRGNVSGRRFLNEFHIEGNSFSMQILDCITKFDLEKGYNPAGIPPVLPVFLRYVDAEKVKEIKLRAKKGRPTTEEAKAFLSKMLTDCLSRGWDEVDFINNVREMVEARPSPSKKVKVSSDDSEDFNQSKPGKTKTEKVYLCRIGHKWERFKSLTESERAMKSDDKKVMGPVEFPEEKLHCAYCKFRLDGTVVSVRKEKGVDHMHMGCYWMEVAHPSQIPVGMTVLVAPEGSYYTYLGTEKGGWKRKENETPVNPGVPVEGVSAPSGETDKQTEALQPAS